MDSVTDVILRKCRSHVQIQGIFGEYVHYCHEEELGCCSVG